VVTPTPIHDVQGAAHLSPKNGQSVTGVSGIVTARTTNGFWFQDPSPDASDATSEGLFVFTSSAPTVAAGDAVIVGGRVSEFRPGGSGGTTNLTTTEITGPSVSVVSSGNPLPAPAVIGTGGRVPPTEVIEDDATGDVETSGGFDPASDGVDFYESLEGMRVQLNDAVATGPTSSFGETPVVGDDGANAGVRTNRGGVVVRPGDFNPERVFLDDQLVPTPRVNVGDHFPGAVVGVMDYSFGNFKLEMTATPTVASGGLQREVTDPAAANQLAVATFNVENLDPGDPQSKFDQLAGLIVNNLRSPDVVAVEEIQDDNGPTDNGVVTAGATFAKLIAAVQAAGGPSYDFRAIDPVNDQDGGEPGGNIRVGFLFRTDRGLAFIDRPGGTPTGATSVVGTGADTRLSFSPGRIDPTNPAFTTSRKPLAGEFTFDGRHLFLIANHFNSKGGDQPLFGHFQPPAQVTVAQRTQQAQVVHDFVASIEAADPDAGVVVLGDLNDFEFSQALGTLKAGVLHDLIETLPQAERYTYDFEGNSQTLDHILLSHALFERPFTYDAVHVNSEFADQASDHDPQVVRITLGPLFDFTGFLSPVRNLPARNSANAGQVVPVRFSLNGNQGLDVFAPGYPRSRQVPCDSTAPVTATEPTASPGNAGLTFNPDTGTYTYPWQTSKSWAGTCRQLVVELSDGSVHRANFQFR
jgi:predicted extracellular nuclease